jgi:hypothetical protein
MLLFQPLNEQLDRGLARMFADEQQQMDWSLYARSRRRAMGNPCFYSRRSAVMLLFQPLNEQLDRGFARMFADEQQQSNWSLRARSRRRALGNPCRFSRGSAVRLFGDCIASAVRKRLVATYWWVRRPMTMTACVHLKPEQA